jgi:hypothetical protein
MASHVAPARPLPPIGAVLLCLERGSLAAYPVTVERHLGRYLFAGGHRFHVYDDWKVGTTRHTWRTAAAMVWLASPEEQAAAEAKVCHTMPASRPEIQWLPPAAPAGPAEPTEAW